MLFGGKAQGQWDLDTLRQSSGTNHLKNENELLRKD